MRYIIFFFAVLLICKPAAGETIVKYRADGTVEWARTHGIDSGPYLSDPNDYSTELPGFSVEPNLSSVKGIDIIYWKRGLGGQYRRMNQAERDVVDAPGIARRNKAARVSLESVDFLKALGATDEQADFITTGGGP